MRFFKAPGDATQGSIKGYFISFFVPFFFGAMIQQVYFMVDTVIVGRYLGANALASVGAATVLVNMAGGIGGGMIQGFGVLVAQAFGSKDQAQIQRYLKGSFYLAAVVTIIIMTVFISCNHLMLSAMNTLPELYSDMRTYQLVNYWGLPTLFAFRLICVIQQSMGDSKTPVFFSTVSSIANVVFSLFFVVVMDWQVMGVALGTVTAQLIAAVGCIVVMRLRMRESIRTKSIKPDKSSIKALIAIGLPMSMQPAIITLGGLFIQTAMNDFTPAHIAASAAISRVSSLAMQVYLIIGSTVSVFVAQNYGAKQYTRLKEGVRFANIVSSIYSVIMLAVTPLFFRQIVGSILGDNITPEVYDLSGQFFYALLFFYPVLGVLEVYRSSVRGMGKGFVTMLSSVTEVIGKTFMVFVMGHFYGFDAIRFSNPVSWVFTLIPVIPCYIHTMHKIKKQEREKSGYE